MKILLLTPPLKAGAVYGLLAPVAPSLPPLGLCSLGAVLLKEGYRVRIIDAGPARLSLGKVVEEAVDYSPEVIGISATTCSYPAARRLLEKLGAVLPESKLILGGPHISALPLPTMQECPALDIAVVGEGEVTLKQVVSSLAAGGDLGQVAGILYRDGGEICQTRSRPPIENLDGLPLPARYLLGDQGLYHPTPLRGRGKTTSMVTSRGCPLQCSYCDQSVFGNRWRAFSAERILQEMKQLVNDSRIAFISFEDDNFLLDRERVEELCDSITNSGIDVGWGCSARVESITPRVLSRMKAAGCHYIYLGIESGCRRVLELLGRNPDLVLVEKGIAMIKKAGIRAYGAFMMGIPTETEAELAQTARLALSLPLDGLFLFQYTPYPNTALRRLAQETGRVSPRWEDYSAHLTSAAYVSNSLPPAVLRKYIFGTYRKFFLRPRLLSRWAKFARSPGSWKVLASLIFRRI